MNELWSQVYGYWCGIRRYRWYGILVAWIIAIAGWTYVVWMPDQYQSTARVYVDTDSLLRPLLHGLAVQPDVEQRLSIMTQTLLSQPNLEKVIQQTDMDLSITTPKQKESLLNQLKNAISVQASKGNLYKISYEAPDSKLARRVVQSILNIFVEKTLGTSQSDTNNARQFIDQQIKVYEKLLSSAEKELMNFKREHVGLMPNEKGDYYQRLQTDLENLNVARTKLNMAIGRRDAIRRQLGGEEPVIGFGSYGSSAKDAIDIRIQSLQAQLDEVLLKYTDKHPDVAALRETIAMLREQKKNRTSISIPKIEMNTSNENEADKHQSEGNFSLQGGNFYYQQMQIALAEADAEIASQTAQVAVLEQNIKQLRELVDTIPKVEAELANLNRDYGVYKKNYEQLLIRRESAKMGGKIDESPENVKFRIVDPPTEPLLPSGPNRPLLITLVLFVAVGIGTAFAFLLSQLKSVFYTRQDLEDITGLPVLGIVSMVLSENILRKQRVSLVSFLFALSLLIVGYGLLISNYLFSIKVLDVIRHSIA
jgi:polysaccharide chain length determinant protein (PEP-CTERM system associated)